MARSLGELRGIDAVWPALLALNFGAGCSNASDSATGPGSAAAGQGGAGAAGATGPASGSGNPSSSTVGVGPTSTGAGTGGSAFVCDPPAEPGSIWEKTAEAYAEIDPVPMCKYRGEVMLIFNDAAL